MARGGWLEDLGMQEALDYSRLRRCLLCPAQE